ncbi:MAG TPA: TonB family protein [Steroidobacteraceae bacterium]|nr:TonB family protein [Steroidobacteraceae bacterium]
MKTLVPLASAGLLMSLPAMAQRIENPRALRLEGEQAAQLRLLRGDTPEQHFPAAAKAAALDGVVVVDVLLNDAGQVLEAQVVSEQPGGHGFGLAALDTVKTFEFENPHRRLLLLALTVEFLP